MPGDSLHNPLDAPRARRLNTPRFRPNIGADAEEARSGESRWLVG